MLLPTYNFKIAFIAEEVEFDKYEPTAAIYFKNYPWVLSSSDIFKRFLSSNFPNLPATRQFYGNHPSVDQLIRYINSQDRTSLDVRSAAFKRWWRQLPFANGVLDFDYISSTLDSLTRRLNSRGSNPRSRDALQREVRALGDIVRTEAQVNTYASLADRLNKVA